MMIGTFRWNRQKPRFGKLSRSVASTSNDRQMFAFSLVVRIFRLIFGSLLQLLLFAALLYPILAAPPLHWFYPVAAPAGPASVYVAGAGFPGFWFHLGLLQSLPTLREHDYYCFSSGCLSVVMAMMNVTRDTAVDLTFDIQQDWRSGQLSRYDMVHRFFDNILVHAPNNTHINDIIDRIHVLVTTIDEGVTIQTASTLEELQDLVVRTTWIPFVTGRTVFHIDSSGRRHLDGAFSRWLHPRCQHDLSVPFTWDTVAHSLNPGLNRNQVNRLWTSGQEYRHVLHSSVGVAPLS